MHVLFFSKIPQLLEGNGFETWQTSKKQTKISLTFVGRSTTGTLYGLLKAAARQPIFCCRTADFLSGSNRVKICRDISLPHTSRFSLATNCVSASISAMLEKTLVHVTLMTIPHWLRYARAPTNCLGPPHTSRQDPRRRFENQHCQISPDKNQLVCSSLNQNVSIALFFSQKETRIVFCARRETIVHGQCQNSKRIQQTWLCFKSIISINCENPIPESIQLHVIGSSKSLGRPTIMLLRQVATN